MEDVQVDGPKEVTDEDFRKLLTEKELEGLAQMREKDPELTKRWNDAFLARFLMARKGDVDRALTMLKNHTAWREKWKVETEFHVDSFKPFFSSGMNVWAPCAKDKAGRAVVYLRPRHMHPSLLDDMQRYIHFSYFSTDVMLDTDISFMREGMIVVEDFNGATLSTFSGFMGGKVDTKELFDNIQENIPARIRQIILLDAPWYVRMLIALVKPFMKKRMREKIVSIRTEELTDYVAKENILREYGGTLDFDYMAWTEDMLQHRDYLSEGKYYSLEGADMFREKYTLKEEEGSSKKKEETKGETKKSKGDMKKSKSKSDAK